MDQFMQSLGMPILVSYGVEAPAKKFAHRFEVEDY